MSVPFVLSIGIVSGIGFLIGWLATAAASIAAAVAAALAAVWAIMGPILFAIWQAVGGLWSNVLQPAWEYVKAFGEQLWQVYEDNIKPILDRLSGVFKALRDVYKTFIQPIRDMISLLEQFLTITHLANTALGQWLDGELHAIDGKIAQVWAELTKPINVLMHLVNEVILDARGILQAPLLLESTAAYMGHIASQWWTKSLATIQTDWGKVLDQFHTGPRIAQAHDNAQSLLRDGSGPLADHVTYAQNVFQLYTSDQYEQFDYQVAGVGPSGQPTTPA